MRGVRLQQVALHTYGGNLAIAVMGVGIGLSMMIMFPIYGLNQGIQAIIGYNYGARHPLVLILPKFFSLDGVWIRGHSNRQRLPISPLRVLPAFCFLWR